MRTLGRYVVFDEIASGGMASVHIGRMLAPAGFGRTVAIKRLHRQYAKDPDFVSMLINEARVVSRIHHPNVVPTLDIVHARGELCLILEYVPGENLKNLQTLAAERGVRIPESVAFALVIDVLRGLDAAHEARTEAGAPLGIIHRDVSPQNILVGVDGSARLLDFGIARAADASLHSDGGTLKGKLSYMSPEQLRLDRDLTRAADIYAASVVLWELLTGRRLFEGVEKSQIAALVLSGAVRSPRAILPSISEELEDIVMRGLESAPEARFATAREMASRLEACGRVATPREVADFVSSIAADSLAARALVIGRIEKETARDVDVRAIANEIARATDDEVTDTGANPPVATSPSVSNDASKDVAPSARPGTALRRGRALLALAAVACIVGGVIVLRAGTHGRSDTPSAVAPAPEKPADTPSAVVVDPQPSTPPVTDPTAATDPARKPRRSAESGSPVKTRVVHPAARPSSTHGNELFDRN